MNTQCSYQGRRGLILNGKGQICNYFEHVSMKMGPRIGRRLVWIHKVGTCRQCRNVCIMDIVITTPVDILIFQFLFDQFKKRGQLQASIMLLDISSVMVIWISLKDISHCELGTGVYEMECMNYINKSQRIGS